MLDFLIESVCDIADLFLDFFVEKILRRKREKKNKENVNGGTSEHTEDEQGQ